MQVFYKCSQRFLVTDYRGHRQTISAHLRNWSRSMHADKLDTITQSHQGTEMALNSDATCLPSTLLLLLLLLTNRLMWLEKLEKRKHFPQQTVPVYSAIYHGSKVSLTKTIAGCCRGIFHGLIPVPMLVQSVHRRKQRRVR